MGKRRYVEMSVAPKIHVPPVKVAKGGKASPVTRDKR